MGQPGPRDGPKGAGAAEAVGQEKLGKERSRGAHAGVLPPPPLALVIVVQVVAARAAAQSSGPDRHPGPGHGWLQTLCTPRTRPAAQARPNSATASTCLEEEAARHEALLVGPQVAPS